VRFCIATVVFLLLASSHTAAQGWSGPFQLTNDSFADINPSACREWLSGTETRLVWQSNRNGDWDIYSRLCYFYNGSGWEDEMPVCTDSGDDVTPVIAARFDEAEGWSTGVSGSGANRRSRPHLGCPRGRI